MSNFNSRNRKNKRLALILTIAIHFMLFGGIAFATDDNFSSKIADIVQSWTGGEKDDKAEPVANKS